MNIELPRVVTRFLRHYSNIIVSQIAALLLILGIVVVLVGVFFICWTLGTWILGLPLLILGLYAVYARAALRVSPSGVLTALLNFHLACDGLGRDHGARIV